MFTVEGVLMKYRDHSQESNILILNIMFHKFFYKVGITTKRNS